MMSADDLFEHIRDAVDQTLEMAEATAKISEETKDILAELTLTRRGDGEVMLDITALERMKTSANEWSNSPKNPNDFLVNPTRLPQLVPGLQGLTSGQYLTFVQRPLELNGDNAPFLERKTQKLYKHYQAKELIKQRTQIFGPFQRLVAKLLIEGVLKSEHPDDDAKTLEEKRDALSAQDQIKLSAAKLDLPENMMMDRLFQYAVTLHSMDTIKCKVEKIAKAQGGFEKALKQLAAQDTGPSSKTRIKDLFLGFQSDLEKMNKMSRTMVNPLMPIVEKTKSDHFETTVSALHRGAAQLDAIVTRWIIIMSEAQNTKDPRPPVDKIKGMHKVLTSK